MKSRKIILFLTLIIIAGLIFYFEGTKPKIGGNSFENPIEEIVNEGINETNIDAETLERLEFKSKNYKKAIELVEPEGYINTDKITISENIGKKVILVDFWTYSCINCQRTFPYITSWYEKYKDQGLIIIGVHTPEFEFEKDYNNVLDAVRKWNINYPVVQDNDYQTWTAYKNRFWPRKYLIDIDGFIVYDHVGEGGYTETEKKIQELLYERNEVLQLNQEISKDISKVEAETPEFQKINTPEIYFGYGFERGHMGNKEGWQPEKTVDYELPASFLDNKFYLEGEWKNNKDNMELISENGKIILKYNAKIINLVAGSDEEKEITVKLDNKEIRKINISGYDLHRINEDEDYSQHTLELLVPGGVMVYTFTFG